MGQKDGEGTGLYGKEGPEISAKEQSRKYTEAEVVRDTIAVGEDAPALFTTGSTSMFFYGNPYNRVNRAMRPDGIGRAVYKSR